MELKFWLCLCLVSLIVLIVDAGGSINTRRRDPRKLFGGYRITPKICKPTRSTPTLSQQQGTNVCMFNHECSQRNGQVVGACMDGFLFGACCQLPPGSLVGDYLGTADEDLLSVGILDGNHVPLKVPPTPKPPFEITSGALSQITASLLNTDNNILPTVQDNAVVQFSGDQDIFSTTGVTHPDGPDTIILNPHDNDINPNVFYKPTTQSVLDDKKTTTRSSSERPSPTTVHVSISGGNINSYTPIPTLQRPMFRPKPTQDNYVLVPTIVHDVVKPNKTQEYDSIVNIIQMLNQTSTSLKPPSTSYVVSATPSTITRRPAPSKITTTSKRPSSTTIKVPSTSYIFSSTIPPKRTTTTTKEVLITRKQTKKPTKNTGKPTKGNTRRPTTTSQKPPSTSYIYSSTFRPTFHSTFANSPEAFVTSSRPYSTSTTKPPSTSYVYSSHIPTKRPATTVNSHVSGPTFSVTSAPTLFSSQYSPYPSAAPTLIVLAPVSDDLAIPSDDMIPIEATALPQRPSSTTTYRPPQHVSALPQRKPINHVVVNNHVTQNIYSSPRPPAEPSPTVLITPKPTISSTPTASTPIMDVDDDTVVLTSSDDLINFPPVRNPNLNMSVPIITDEDVTTPTFVEDEALNNNIESFVNQIIIGLQEPFQGLKDVVYNKNSSAALSLISTSTSTTSAPTKKPVKKQGTTTKKPVTRKPTSSSTNTIRTTKKSTTRKSSPTTNSPTRRPTTTTRRSPSTVTKKPVITTTPNLIETQDGGIATISQDYRDQCGVRPLVKTGRIVGGKGASFGEFPWQVLVRESTWLGLFTKNKCGGVLISDKYVMTAAHCQPGFLASLVAVFGEFDISGDLESKKPVSRNVKRVIVHRKYDAATFENDLALLELESPVTFDAHIIPICLPRENEDFTGRMATVTGWGRLKYGGGVPSVLQEVQVPIMENHVCQEMFRTAGHQKVILESFLCAGYANGQKDSCEGDSGGPLVLQRPDGRYQLAGTVSHGIKCAAPYLPGVYMRTTYYKPWITSITGIQ